jgi:protein-L-isoaspartate(D-aspartate) O-methyltransferase
VTDRTVTDSPQADMLRTRLVDDLLAGGSISSTPVEAAMRTVPRHLFAPEASLEDAYANDVVRTKHDANGITTSSVSAPWLQAAMLEQAQITPGMRCLEIGSGGYNAALMAELAGPAGSVTTVDIDPYVTERARRFLTTAGYDHVRVIERDAELGVAEHAPYDRILVTVGVWDLPPAWWNQLTAQGRIVVPLRMRGLSRSVALDRDGDRLISVDHQMAGFVAVQGDGAHPERLITLHGDDIGLRFDDDEPPADAEPLRRALHTPRTQAWSGVQFGGQEPFDTLFLWLATVLDAYGLLSRARTEQARALADPASPIATPTLLSADSFAYVTFRQLGQDTFEFGAHGHGPDSDRLAAQLVEHIRTWNREHRHGAPAAITVNPAGAALPPLSGGRVIHKRHTTVTVTWP